MTLQARLTDLQREIGNVITVLERRQCFDSAEEAREHSQQIKMLRKWRADVLALLDDARPAHEQALEALEFAAGAIGDAIGCEDGLDGRAGETVLRMIDAALVANGRQPMRKPQHDADIEWFRQYLRERLAVLGDDARPAEGGAALIAAERQRQIEHEGWTPEHDDAHSTGEIVSAAVCYAVYGSHQTRGTAEECVALVLSRWPFELTWWKPSDDPVRNLVKAGALIAAEIDRLQRKLPPSPSPSREEP